MKRNTILTSAIVLALGCTGTVSAQSTKECEAEATRLTTEVAHSTLTGAAKAELSKALSDAKTADAALCEQVVARARREIGAKPETTAAADPTAGTYEQGHASADASLPSHPGAAANDSSAAGVSASGDLAEGNASAHETLKSKAAPAGATASGKHAGALGSMSAKDLIDKPVKNATGKQIGEINAIVMDKRTGAHGYAVIGFGGLFGVGEKEALVGLDDLHVSADGNIQMSATGDSDFNTYPEYVKEDFMEYEGQMAQLQ